ncbi:MAG: hypothetical protein KGL17_02335 [Betaproteobacteria bacterium]|nr:hypothetical protein [Betaproteobacteria bacterium]
MAEERPPLPDLHMGNVAAAVCHKMAAAGAIVLIANHDGTIGMSGANVNNFLANEMLSRGIQMNLNQHDEFVKRGDAGLAAQQTQQLIDAQNGVTQ